MKPVEFIIKEGDEHLTSHSGLALIGALICCRVTRIS